MKCPYRADKNCKDMEYNKYANFCKLCLIGQQADQMSLMNSAIANLTASIEERLIRDRLRE